MPTFDPNEVYVPLWDWGLSPSQLRAAAGLPDPVDGPPAPTNALTPAERVAGTTEDMMAQGHTDLIIFNYTRGNPHAAELAHKNAAQIRDCCAIAISRDPKGHWPAVEQIHMDAAGQARLVKILSEEWRGAAGLPDPVEVNWNPPAGATKAILDLGRTVANEAEFLDMAGMPPMSDAGTFLNDYLDKHIERYIVGCRLEDMPDEPIVIEPPKEPR